MGPNDHSTRTAIAGLFERKPRWGLTLRGWLSVGLAATTFAIALVATIHPFLAINSPLGADTLVVEGWIPEYAIRQVVSRIREGKYQHVYTTGGPVSGVKMPAADDDTYAYVAAQRLSAFGVDRHSFAMVPANTVTRDRTFHSAQMLRQYLQQNHLGPGQIDVATLGVHARRTRLLFQEAFSADVKVGVLALENEEYRADRWWRYSEGVKEVVSETAAYLYARFLFRP